MLSILHAKEEKNEGIKAGKFLCSNFKVPIQILKSIWPDSRGSDLIWLFLLETFRDVFHPPPHNSLALLISFIFKWPH